MIPFAIVLAVGASLVAIGLALDHYAPAVDDALAPLDHDDLFARLMCDEEWERLVAAVEGPDFVLWEQEVSS